MPGILPVRKPFLHPFNPSAARNMTVNCCNRSGVQHFAAATDIDRQVAGGIDLCIAAATDLYIGVGTGCRAAVYFATTTLTDIKGVADFAC